MGSLASFSVFKRLLAWDIRSLANLMVQLYISGPKRILASVEARSTLCEKIRSCQFKDMRLCVIHDQVCSGESRRATIDSEGDQRPGILIQRLPIAGWKWGWITMDFVDGLPHTFAAPMVHQGMLRACVIDFGGQWEQHLDFVEFANNNGYHSSIEMAPFEALYGRDREGDGDGSWGSNRRSYGGFDDDRRGPPSRGSEFDQPSRADEADNWGSMKKSLPMQSMDSRSNRYGSLGTGGGGISRADGDDNWGSSKMTNAAPPPPPQGSRSWFPDSRPEPERWFREVNHERQRLVLDPPKVEMGNENVNEIVVKVNKPNPFGAARPREEVLAEKGLDWKKLDKEIEVKKAIGSRPTSSQSSRPGSSHSARSEGTALQGGMVEGVGVKPKPKVNPFGDAKPREVLLEEKGLDWRKIDLDLEHRRVDRPDTEEEKNLKEEIEHLRKEATQCSEEDKTNLQNVINQKERDLELLIRDLDDKIRFSQKPLQRPGSGSGRGAGHPDRSLSQPASYEDRRAGDQMDRPRSRSGGDAWARPSDQMERPRSRGGVDAWARSNEHVERPQSRGGGDAWTRPGSGQKGLDKCRTGGWLKLMGTA
ncbi:hypothetical protein T459_27796 [Capsicum annuum]|uniref:Eukaryotic translation initiation factor 4B2-like n=1 Tax=Capsicum annuum TaxID=4072 RepID=A0A2G2YF25_CAPAN|nr:hypothetical protein T459_27796 [Capsicum annuum]